MTDWQYIDAECFNCAGNVFRAWWVIDKDHPEGGARQIVVQCRSCEVLSDLRSPDPGVIRWDR